MRKITALTFLTLDGVMQGPGGPSEDTSGGFTSGGWTVPYFDQALAEIMTEQMGRPFDLLLGRKTFEILAAHWPQHGPDEPINQATKYVASNTMRDHDWATTVVLRGDAPEAVRALKETEGPDLQVHGSSELLQTLLAHDLVDELWLKFFPVTIGTGKRLFGEGAIPEAFELLDATATPAGVIVASYRRAGDLETGSF